MENDGLSAYFQYIINTCDEKTVALSAIAGKDIFGRENGHMPILPIVKVVMDLRSRNLWSMPINIARFTNVAQG